MKKKSIFISPQERIIREQQKNAKLKADLAKAKADLDYLAMMTEIELETESEDEADEEP